MVPLSMGLQSHQLDELRVAATEAAQHAYCPYSHYPVGAAVLANDGKIYRGCNVENASYGLTICAERSAIFQMVAGGGSGNQSDLVFEARHWAVTPPSTTSSEPVT